MRYNAAPCPPLLNTALSDGGHGAALCGLKVRVVSPRLCPPYKPSDNRIQLCRPGRAQREPGSPPARGRQPRGSGGLLSLTAQPRYTALNGDKPMGDMRLIVAGAGGRMGRTLIHAIAATDGAPRAGAVPAKGAPPIRRDARARPGPRPNHAAGR